MDMMSSRLSATAPARLGAKDWAVATALAVATGVFVWRHISHPVLPMEDASMLLRYSQNLARGNGIVWNVGEHPVEGATDFLYMVLVGGLSWLTKVGVTSVATWILLLSHVGCVVVLYAAMRRLFDAPMLVAVGFSAALGAGLGWHYVNTGFSAPFYGLFALLSWMVGTVCVLYGVTWRRAIAFGLLCFVTGLIRPDGVILGVLMLCSTVYGVREKRVTLWISFGAIFAVLGGVYFVWRLHYFGYLFPNPFYAKRAAGFAVDSIKLSGRMTVEMLLPFLPLVGLGFRNMAARRQLLRWLITVVPFICVWMLISLANNHYARFQYVMIPLTMLWMGELVSTWWAELKLRGGEVFRVVRLPLAGLAIMLFGVAIFYNMHLYPGTFSNVGAQSIAARLKPFAAKHYTMVVTEAGDLPFYSEWQAVDALGLNDAFIAHHNGVLTEAYLDGYKPEILMYNQWSAFRSLEDIRAQATGQATLTTDALSQNDAIMRHYAVSHGYVLAAMWGATYCNYHVFWVRPDFPDRDAIVSAIKDHPFYTQGEGLLAYDFRDAPIPTVPCTI